MRSSDEVTLKGTIVCAKCTLKRPDAKACQNVLLSPVKYYYVEQDYTVGSTPLDSLRASRESVAAAIARTS